MSAGGHSFHKKDWAEAAALAGLGATGAGAMGAGPLAGLMGAAPAAAGNVAGAMAALPASGAAELAAAGPVTPGIASTIAQTSLLGHAIDPSMLGNVGRGAQMAQRAMTLMQPPAPAPMQSHVGGPVRPSAPFQLYPQAQSQLPPELAVLPATDPQVIEWKKQHGVMT